MTLGAACSKKLCSAAPSHIEGDGRLQASMIGRPMADDSCSRETLVNPLPADPASERGQELLLITMRGNHVGEIFPIDRRRPLTIIGRDDTSDVQVLDAEISRRHAALRFDDRTNKFILIDLKSANGTWANGSRVREDVPIQAGDKIRLGQSTILRVTLSSEPEANYARQMYQAVLRDPLTGAFNRRYLDERIETEIAFAKRHAEPLALILLDIDHFKRVNDTFGHVAGDAVLKQFVKLIESQVRIEDVVARYGGEEFAVLCRETGTRPAMVLAERLCQAAMKNAFTHDGTPIPMTVSIGVANILARPKITPVEFFDAADKALYAAKAAGRNRCCHNGGKV